MRFSVLKRLLPCFMLIMTLILGDFTLAEAKTARPSVTWNGKTYTVSKETYSEKYWSKPPFAYYDIDGLVVKNNTTGEVFRLFMYDNFSTIVYVNDHYEAIGAVPYEERLYSYDEFGQPYTSDISFNPYSSYGTYSVLGIANGEYWGVDGIYSYLTKLERYNPDAYAAMLADPITNPGGEDLQKWYNLLREYNLEHVAVNPEALTIDEWDEWDAYHWALIKKYNDLYNPSDDGDNGYLPPEVWDMIESEEEAYLQMIYARRATGI